MGIQTIDVQITIESATVPRASFDSILIAAHHLIPGNRVQRFANLSEAETFGITVTAYPWIHRLLTVAFSQDPRPSSIFVGRRDNVPAQNVLFTPTVPTIPTGETLDFTITVEGQDATYTAVAGDGVAEVITGLKAAVDALASPALPTTTTDVGPGTSLRIEVDQGSAPGRILTFETSLGFPATAQIEVENVTADPGLAADLSAIRNENETWYGLVLDSNGEAEVSAASSWAQSRVVLLSADAENGEHVDPAVTDDLGSTVLGLTRDRTTLIYSDQSIGLGYGLAVLAERFPAADPGASNYSYRVLRGVPSYDLNSAQATALKDKRVNMFLTDLEGTPGTVFGAVSETDRYIDQRRGIDALTQSIRASVASLLKTQDKVSLRSTTGIAQVKDAMEDGAQAFIEDGIESRLLVQGSFVASVPDPDNITDADANERLLRDLTFTARLSTPINEIIIRGTVSV